MSGHTHSGYASSNHIHKTGDIVYGNPLPINLGGTGCATISDIKDTLGIRNFEFNEDKYMLHASQITCHGYTGTTGVSWELSTSPPVLTIFDSSYIFLGLGKFTYSYENGRYVNVEVRGSNNRYTIIIVNDGGNATRNFIVTALW